MNNTQELQNEVMSKNIIIAEFWGYKFYPADPIWKQLLYNGIEAHYWIEKKNKSIQKLLPKHFRFHFDWNWLLPVIKKITKLNVLVEPYNEELIGAHAEFCVNIRDKVMDNDFDNAYEMVVNFINVYNKNKK